MSARRVVFGVMALLLVSIPCGAQQAHPATHDAIAEDHAQLLKTTESFVRELFAWGPNIPVKLGPLAPSVAGDFYDVPVQVTLDGRVEKGEVYVSKDGKTLLRGTLYNMEADPFAATRAKLKLDGDPTLGPANASVTLVEFSDFECPHCQELYEVMKTIEVKYPQIRIVYKNFPLTQIHPWAETAAIGGECAYQESHAAFWKVESSIFENQDTITPDNVWNQLVQYAKQAGLQPDTFKACMASAEAKKAVAEDRADGVALGVDSTPTVYVNGRPLIGGDLNALEQYINFELAKTSAARR